MDTLLAIFAIAIAICIILAIFSSIYYTSKERKALEKKIDTYRVNEMLAENKEEESFWHTLCFAAELDYFKLYKEPYKGTRYK